MAKHVSTLTLDDFKVFPLWTWADEIDEGLVTPLENTDFLEEHDAIFVSTLFTLKDGSQLPGFIALRVRDYSVYLISLSDVMGQLFDLPLQPELIDFVKQEALAKHIRKQANELFPMHYEAKITSIKILKGDINIRANKLLT